MDSFSDIDIPNPEDSSEESAFDTFVLAQVQLADPLFFEQYKPVLLGTYKFDDFADRMHFDLEVYLPKIRELRQAGRISSVEEARNAARRVVSEITHPAQIFGLSQRVAKELMPR